MASRTTKLFKQSASVFAIVLLMSCSTEAKFDYAAHINAKMSQLTFIDNKLESLTNED
jgi:hypothetical protein